MKIQRTFKGRNHTRGARFLEHAAVAAVRPARMRRGMTTAAGLRSDRGRIVIGKNGTFRLLSEGRGKKRPREEGPEVHGLFRSSVTRLSISPASMTPSFL